MHLHFETVFQHQQWCYELHQFLTLLSRQPLLAPPEKRLMFKEIKLIRCQTPYLRSNKILASINYMFQDQKIQSAMQIHPQQSDIFQADIPYSLKLEAVHGCLTPKYELSNKWSMRNIVPMFPLGQPVQTPGACDSRESSSLIQPAHSPESRK